jgi:hypothetical protein
MKKLFKTDKAIYSAVAAFNAIMLLCGIVFNNIGFWGALLPLNIMIAAIISEFHS